VESGYTHHVTTVQSLLKQYTDFKTRIKTAFGKVENKLYFKDYSEYHSSVYLLETLIGAGNIDSSTTMQELEKYLKVPDDSKISKKIKNMKNAIDTLFPILFDFVSLSKIVAERFTTKFIQELHQKVTVNLVETPGVYRTKWAAPNQETWMYLLPQKIDNNLEKLCECVRREIEKEKDSSISDEEILVGRIKIVATFLTEFLQIHPFTNGNGRVGRLLISWLMTDLSVVPVPLLASRASRDIYLQCLRDQRYTTPISPFNLARLILESVVHTMCMVCYAVDI